MTSEETTPLFEPRIQPNGPMFIPRPPTFFPTLRPGRNRNASPADLKHRHLFGDDVFFKDSTHTRIFFQNVKGLTFSTSCEDFKYCLDTLHLQMDLVGLSETNLPWLQLPHLSAEFRNCIRRQFTVGKAVYSSPASTVDPILHTDNFQAGGTVTFAVGNLVPTVAHPNTPIHDSTGMGRWSGLTVRDRANALLSVITVYRVCRGSISSSPIGSSFNREFCYLREGGDAQPNPRTHILTSLTTFVNKLQSQNHAILLMIDANSTLASDSVFLEFCNTCTLNDLHANDPAPSTYLGAPGRRIDYMLGCPRVLDSVRRSGSLSYYQGPQSDHRGLFVDLDLKSLLGYTTTPAQFPTPALRLLKAGNPELVAKYVESVNSYYLSHNMRPRIDRLYNTFSTLPREEVRRRLEAWDDDQGRAMLNAEKSLQKPPSKSHWSPALRNAGIIRRYWKLRLHDANQSTNHSSRILRLEDQIRQHDTSFRLPLSDATLSIADICQHLTQASTHFRTIQKNSHEYRMRSLYDSLSLYESGASPLTPQEAKARSKIVRSTIRNETTRGVFGNIRKQLSSEAHSGLTFINVSSATLSPTSTTTPYQYLQEQGTHPIAWEKVIDKANIDAQILKYS